MSWGKHTKVEKFSAPIEKENTKIDKDGNEDFVTISYQIKLVDSARFMASSLSNNLTEGIHKIECEDLTIKFIQTSLTKN